MITVPIDEVKLKDILKTALSEALKENRDLVQDIVEEVMEDIGLVYAIWQGLDSKSISRKEVFEILEGAGT